MQVTVRDLMTSQPLTVRELSTVQETTRKILERAASEAYVVDEAGRLLGTVPDYSLLKARMIQSDSQEPVTRFMSRNMVILNADMSLEEVAGYFRESCHPRLAVVEAGRVIGQLSRRDILRAMVVMEEIATASVNDEFESAVPSNAAAASDAGRIHRLESPEETALPEPAGLRSTSEFETIKAGSSASSLVTR